MIGSQLPLLFITDVVYLSYVLFLLTEDFVHRSELAEYTSFACLSLDTNYSGNSRKCFSVAILCGFTRDAVYAD